MNCDCKKWEQNMPLLDGCVVIADIHHCQYTGSQFAFCPWCGKRLTIVEQRIDDIKTSSDS